MSLELITDHVTRALDRRISQYFEKPRLERFFACYLARIQEFENSQWEVLIGRAVDTAVGVNLDALGRIVGQPRRGSTDDAYRVYIQARIIVNLSRGRWPELFDLMDLLLPNPNPSSFLSTRGVFEHYPASFDIETTFPVVEPEVVAEMFQQAAAAGVRFGLIWQENEASAEHHAFVFTQDEEDDTLSGFGTESGDTGGKWANDL
jgi:hypothetical protein